MVIALSRGWRSWLMPGVPLVSAALARYVRKRIRPLVPVLPGHSTGFELCTFFLPPSPAATAVLPLTPWCVCCHSVVVAAAAGDYLVLVGALWFVVCDWWPCSPPSLAVGGLGVPVHGWLLRLLATMIVIATVARVLAMRWGLCVCHFGASAHNKTLHLVCRGVFPKTDNSSLSPCLGAWPLVASS